MVTFFMTNLLLLEYKTHDNPKMATNLNKDCSRFFVILELLWICFSLSKWIFSCSLYGHIASPPLPPLCWLLSFEWLSYFEHAIWSLQTRWFLVHVFGATSNHIWLKYRCLVRISKRIRHVYFVMNPLLCKRDSYWAYLTINTVIIHWGCLSRLVYLQRQMVKRIFKFFSATSQLIVNMVEKTYVIVKGINKHALPITS